MKTLTYLLSGIVLFASCSNSEKKSETSQESKKDVSELTYNEIYQAVFPERLERFEYHDEEIENTYLDSLIISENGVCGEEDCGVQINIRNNSKEKLDLVLKVAFDVKGMPLNYGVKVTIDAGEDLNTGCSHFCYAGKSYIMDRKIVGSKISGT